MSTKNHAKTCSYVCQIYQIRRFVKIRLAENCNVFFLIILPRNISKHFQINKNQIRGAATKEVLCSKYVLKLLATSLKIIYLFIVWLIEEISVRNCIQQSISCLHLKFLKANYSSPEMLVKHNKQNHFLSSIPLKRHVDNWNDITSGICHSKCSWDGVHFH